MSMPFYVPPEQLVKDRAEYARKGIARGRSIVAIEYVDGVLILAENPSSTLHKISEIYDRIAFAGVGRYNEFEAMRVAGIRHADVKGFMYGRTDVTAKGLANAFAQTLGNIFTHEVKPYEVEILIAELGSEDSPSSFFKVLYDGTLSDEKRFSAIGGTAEALTESIAAGYTDSLDRNEAINLAKEAFVAVAEERQIDGWEGAILDRSAERRTFGRLDHEDFGD